jgi:hypothetical protein
MNYIQIKDVYHNNDLNELKQIISMKEMELTNDE